MEPLNDKELNELLQQWEAPSAPEAMHISMGRHQSAWRWLWSGRIHVPVPIGAAMVFAAAALWVYSGTAVPASISPPAGNAVSRPARQVSPETPAETPPADRAIPVVTENDKAETAALSGFRPVRQIEPRILQERK